MNLRNELLQASKLHFKAQIEKHRINAEKMSSYHDKLEMLDYFDVSLNDKKILND